MPEKERLQQRMRVLQAPWQRHSEIIAAVEKDRNLQRNTLDRLRFVRQTETHANERRQVEDKLRSLEAEPESGRHPGGLDRPTNREA